MPFFHFARHFWAVQRFSCTNTNIDGDHFAYKDQVLTVFIKKVKDAFIGDYLGKSNHDIQK